MSIRSIVASTEFARGLDEARNGRPFNPDNGSWDYERGRCFGFIAPLNMPLRKGRELNPKALALAEAAFNEREPMSDCKQSFERALRAPMLTDGSRLAKGDELLCAECFFARAIERKVRIGLADLTPCPFNLFHRPVSWFDLFAKGERRELIETWLAMANAPEAA